MMDMRTTTNVSTLANDDLKYNLAANQKQSAKVANVVKKTVAA
jgi:hypothetical protein